MKIRLSKEYELTKSVGIMCFSPTNATRKICDAVALGMGSEKPRVWDITLPDTRSEIIAKASTAINDIDHLIVGAPVHAGKLPLQVIECLRALRGAGKECAAIVVYGNRDYGVAPHNMVEILSQNGFSVVAAATFIGQHSYSDIVPIAIGRPDKSDIEKARAFGSTILGVSKPLNLNDVPLQIDMMSKSGKYSALKPSYNENLCVQCGACATACPLGLLSSDSGRYLSKAAEKQCMGCMACVRSCMQKAKVAKANPVVKMAMGIILRQARKKRKEPVIIM